MLINLKNINVNVVIGILLVLVIIYIIYNKKQEVFTGFFPNLPADLEVKLEETETLNLKTEKCHQYLYHHLEHIQKQVFLFDHPFF
jgi:hypothetical protein